MSERVPRLGDVVDDYCPRCRLLLNHDVASLGVNSLGEGAPPQPADVAGIAKVTCRTCHNTHDYRHAQVPPKRKSSRTTADKKNLMDQVLAGMGRPIVPAATAAPAPSEPPLETAPATTPAERKKRDLWAEYQRIQSKDKKD